MRDDFDVEDYLRLYRAQPSARVKQFVLACFKEAHDRGTTFRGAVSFWKRSVPLYLAATTLLILLGLSFVAGRSTSRSVVDKNVATSSDFEWVAADNDLARDTRRGSARSETN